MTAGVLATWLLQAAAGGAVVTLVRPPLRLEERCAIAVVAGLVTGSLASLLLALWIGMGVASALLGPVVLLTLLGAALRLLWPGRMLQPWRESLADARTHPRRTRAVALLAAAAAAGFGVLLAHALFDSRGEIAAGYPTVWADWSLHATAASSFATGSNLPPQDPIFAGTTYRYPFLPDFHAALLITAGSSLTAALAVPDVVLLVAVTVLVASLAQRLTGSVAVGVLAMAVCVLGGGLGFTGAWWDSCTAHAGLTASDCAPATVVTHPGNALAVIAGLPRTVADQPRAYDNLLTDPSLRPAGNIQWYTPMLAWWLPQRGFVFGFATALSVLLLVLVAPGRGSPPRSWSPFVVAGLLTGMLAIVHVHSLIVLLIVLPLLALRDRRREWLALLAAALAVGLPRVVQIAGGGHGTGDTAFPYLEPGWTWNEGTSVARYALDPGGITSAVGRTVRVALTPGFWGFWVLNTGVVVPLCLVVVIALAARRLTAERPGTAALRVHGVCARLLSPFPPALLRSVLPLMAVFAVANVVVFQTWDWDNTKLLAYWYLGGALLLGALVVAWVRRGGLRAFAAALMLTITLLSGVLVSLRYLPWTPQDPTQPFGRYTWASADDRSLAAQVERTTPRDAVFLTDQRPNDPVLTLAGRRAVLGYTGWVYSYGTDPAGRSQDVITMYRGCGGATGDCAALRLLQQYGVSFVEVTSGDDVTMQADLGWWARSFPVAARAGATVVYDVRRP